MGRQEALLVLRRQSSTLVGLQFLVSIISSKSKTLSFKLLLYLHDLALCAMFPLTEGFFFKMCLFSGSLALHH